MLYLYAGVHFHKVKVAVLIYQKLNGTYAFVINGIASGYGGFAHFGTQFIGHKRARAFFYKFLVAALYATIALAKVTCCTKLVACYLYFYVAWFFYKFFHVYAIVFETSSGLSFGSVVCTLHFARFPYNTHTLTTTTCGGF